MSQLVVGHRQEEKVEAQKPAAVGSAAALEGGDRVVVTARPIKDDPERVEIIGLAGPQLNRPSSERHRADKIGPRHGAVGYPPGAGVAAFCQRLSEHLLVGLEGQCGLQIGDRGLELFQVAIEVSADGQEVGVARSQVDRSRQVVDGIREASQVVERMSAMMVGVGVVGLFLDSGRVPLQHRCGGLGEVLGMPGQRAEIDPERREAG